MESMRDQIVARIERLGEGKAFSAKDFLDIASRTTIDVTLATSPRAERFADPPRSLRHAQVNPALGGRIQP